MTISTSCHRMTLGDLRSLIASIDTKYDHLPLTLFDRHNFIINITFIRDRVPFPICTIGRDIKYPPRTHYYQLRIQRENDVQ